MKPLLLLALFMGGAMGAERVIVDTDCGVFGDDGAALAILLRHPDKVRVEAIVTVSGNVWAEESYGHVGRILKLAGRTDIPIHMASREPLLHTAAMSKLQGKLEFAGAFAKARVRLDVASGGVEYLIRTIEASPGEITVLALGPMTNLAIALRMRPEIAAKIKRLVFMGGAYKALGNVTAAAEFNFWFDPEAARVVMRSPIARKEMFGLDITNRAKTVRRLFDEIARADTPLSKLYKDDAGNGYPGFLKNPAATGFLWDELAAAWLVDESIVTGSEELRLDVSTNFPSGYGGVTRLADSRLAPDAALTRVMLGLDSAKAFAIYRDALTARF